MKNSIKSACLSICFTCNITLQVTLISTMFYVEQYCFSYVVEWWYWSGGGALIAKWGDGDALRMSVPRETLGRNIGSRWGVRRCQLRDRSKCLTKKRLLHVKQRMWLGWGGYIPICLSRVKRRTKAILTPKSTSFWAQKFLGWKPISASRFNLSIDWRNFSARDTELSQAHIRI